jgi:hypothetical protein
VKMSMEEVKFQHHVWSTAQREQLRQIFSCLSTHEVKTLSMAFEAGGMICGGAARRIAAPLFNLVKVASKTFYVSSYLNAGDVRPYTEKPGDIDIFFPTNAAIDRFWNHFAVSSIPSVANVSESVLGYARNIQINCGVSIQIVKPMCGSRIEHQLAAFDIYNAMIGINSNRAIIPDNWHFLEEHSMLHVHKFQTDYQLKRIAKWMKKQRYETLSPRTASELGTYAFELLERIKESNGLPTPWKDVKITMDSVRGTLHSLLPHLTNDQLLLLSTVMASRDSYGNIGHNPAMQVIQDRSAATIYSAQDKP